MSHTEKPEIPLKYCQMCEQYLPREAFRRYSWTKAKYCKKCREHHQIILNYKNKQRKEEQDRQKKEADLYYKREKSSKFSILTEIEKLALHYNQIESLKRLDNNKFYTKDELSKLIFPFNIQPKKINNMLYFLQKIGYLRYRKINTKIVQYNIIMYNNKDEPDLSFWILFKRELL